MKNLEESISSSCEKEHSENSSKEHCNLWFGLVKKYNPQYLFGA